MIKIEDILVKIAVAVRIALRRAKQRTIVLPNCVIEISEPSKSGYNPNQVLRTLSLLEFGKDSADVEIAITDMDHVRIRANLPLKMKSEFLEIVLALHAESDDIHYLIRVSCSPDNGAIEVKLLS
jgi:hypothetical protein